MMTGLEQRFCAERIAKKRPFGRKAGSKSARVRATSGSEERRPSSPHQCGARMRAQGCARIREEFRRSETDRTSGERRPSPPFGTNKKGQLKSCPFLFSELFEAVNMPAHPSAGFNILLMLSIWSFAVPAGTSSFFFMKAGSISAINLDGNCNDVSLPVLLFLAERRKSSLRALVMPT